MYIGTIEAVNSDTKAKVRIETWDTIKRLFKVTVNHEEILLSENNLQYLITKVLAEKKLIGQ